MIDKNTANGLLIRPLSVVSPLPSLFLLLWARAALLSSILDAVLHVGEGLEQRRDGRGFARRVLSVGLFHCESGGGSIALAAFLFCP